MTFVELGLNENLLKALTDSGYTQPTPVQAQAIPLALEGRDLMVSSQTGSGKTAAFMLPSLHRLAEQPRPAQAESAPRRNERGGRRPSSRARFQVAQPKMLVLAPTRELAMQVTAATEKYGRQIPHLKAVAILGGMPYPKQMALLGENPEILVATPGRLIDHMESGKIDFSQLQILVLDEADRMLDMGFIDDIEKIVSHTPATRQTWLFSATLDGEIDKIARKLTRDAKIIQVNTPHTTHENIKQRLHFVDDLSHKNRLLDHLLRDTSIDQAIVFTATKRDADTISDRLNLAGFNVAALHGDMHQGARNRTLNAMRRKQVQILVATDVAARGIDVPTITHVFNYDLPRFAEDYIHRIGRTGRAGRDGQAISLVNHAEQLNVRKIERFTQQMIPVEIVIGHEPTKQAHARPAKPQRKFAGKSGFKGAPSASPAGRSHWKNDKTEKSSDQKRGSFAEKSHGSFAAKPRGEFFKSGGAGTSTAPSAAKSSKPARSKSGMQGARPTF